MKYRKKPVVIDALRWDGFALEAPLIREPWGSFLRPTDYVYTAGGNLVIETLEGKMIASVGDMIIRGVKGELYPCKPDIFEATYEPVE